MLILIVILACLRLHSQEMGWGAEGGNEGTYLNLSDVSLKY